MTFEQESRDALHWLREQEITVHFAPVGTVFSTLSWEHTVPAAVGRGLSRSEASTHAPDVSALPDAASGRSLSSTEEAAMSGDSHGCASGVVVDPRKACRCDPDCCTGEIRSEDMTDPSKWCRFCALRLAKEEPCPADPT